MNDPLSAFKATGIVVLLGLFIVPLLPVQLVLLGVRARGAGVLPRWFFRFTCFLVGIRVHRQGKMVAQGPALLVPNHVSYLDMPILGSVGRLSFVSTTEVRGWAFFGFMSTLQRSVYIDRTRRSQAGAARKLIQDRLNLGDILVLFAEGTSTLGTKMIPFKSSLLGVVESKPGDGDADPMVQPVSVAYTRLHGMPMGRRDRPLFAWYGDMELLPHLWRVLKAGPIDVEVIYHEPVLASGFTSRKALARHCEAVVARGLARALSGVRDDRDRASKDRVPSGAVGDVVEPLAAAQ